MRMRRAKERAEAITGRSQPGGAGRESRFTQRFPRGGKGRRVMIPHMGLL